MIDTKLPISYVAQFLGICKCTILLIDKVENFCVREFYSKMSDQEVDNLVVVIKAQIPNVGYSLIKGRLRSSGHRIQWSRVKAAVHRVDGTRAL